MKHKYIRTKDRIYKYTSHSKAFDGVYTTTMGINHLILYKEIIKQADTIEELCDEFVVEDKDDFGIYYNFNLAKHIKGTLYGAIWTDKGLIYVAKMNEKGELELC